MIDVGAADGTALRHFELTLAAGAFGEYRTDDPRNDVAGARHEDRIADANVVIFNVIDVVQRRALDRDAPDRHGSQNGAGIERSGTPDGDGDVDKLGARFARLELEGDRPTRIARHNTQTSLQCEIVHLDHHAVDLVVE